MPCARYRYFQRIFSCLEIIGNFHPIGISPFCTDILPIEFDFRYYFHLSHIQRIMYSFFFIHVERSGINSRTRKRFALFG